MKHEGEVFKTKNYGDLVITKYVSSLEVHVRFINTGFTTTTQIGSIKSGQVKDKMLPTVHGVGVLGDEQTKVDGKTLKEYELWCSMLKRCYSIKYHTDFPTYAGCTVSENFKYFPYFKDWCNQQIGFDEDGWQLDKDIIVKGNRTYSEDTCCFVPREVNTVVKKKYGTNVETYARKPSNRPSAILGIKGKSVHLGTYDTQEEAFLAYKQAKEAYIKEVANRWKDQIDPRVYEALMKYDCDL